MEKINIKNQSREEVQKLTTLVLASEVDFFGIVVEQETEESFEFTILIRSAEDRERVLDIFDFLFTFS